MADKKTENLSAEPSNEYILATYNYLKAECDRANANNLDVYSFSRRLGGHNQDDEGFDLNIGSFCFSIRWAGYYDISDHFDIYDDNGALEKCASIFDVYYKRG